MRSASQILERVNALRPNAYANLLEDYIRQLEIRIQKEIFGVSEPVYNESALALSEPEDMIYELWLFSVIDFLNGEFGRYKNTSAAFSDAWEKLKLTYISDSDEGEDEEEGDKTEESTRIKLW